MMGGWVRRWSRAEDSGVDGLSGLARHEPAWGFAQGAARGSNDMACQHLLLDYPTEIVSISTMSVLPRIAAPLLAQVLRTLRVVVVTGPRQAGKSTFVEHHPDLVGLPYLSLDAPQTLRRARENPEGAIGTYPAHR